MNGGWNNISNEAKNQFKKKKKIDVLVHEPKILHSINHLKFTT